MSSFPDRLKELRKIKGVTQKQVAESVGILEPAYRRYELATSANPTSDILTKLADYFEVSTDYLLGRSDNPNRQ